MIPRRAAGALFAALIGLVLFAGPATAQTSSTPAPSSPSTTLDSVGFPTWIWVVVSIAGLLAVIVVGVRQLRGRPKD